jgi:hypothetical protein
MASIVRKENIMKTITVRVPPNLSLEQSQALLGSVLRKAGHPLCLSGLNINFENAADAENLLYTVEGASLTA